MKSLSLFTIIICALFLNSAAHSERFVGCVSLQTCQKKCTAEQAIFKATDPEKKCTSEHTIDTSIGACYCRN